jgi:hypothetical protein
MADLRALELSHDVAIMIGLNPVANLRGPDAVGPTMGGSLRAARWLPLYRRSRKCSPVHRRSRPRRSILRRFEFPASRCGAVRAGEHEGVWGWVDEIIKCLRRSGSTLPVQRPFARRPGTWVARPRTTATAVAERPFSGLRPALIGCGRSTARLWRRPHPRRTGLTTCACAGSGRRRRTGRGPPCWRRRG